MYTLTPGLKNGVHFKPPFCLHADPISTRNLSVLQPRSADLMLHAANLGVITEILINLCPSPFGLYLRVPEDTTQRGANHSF